jgi:hypothetical protein
MAFERGCRQRHLIVPMPFTSYQCSIVLLFPTHRRRSLRCIHVWLGVRRQARCWFDPQREIQPNRLLFLNTCTEYNRGWYWCPRQGVGHARMVLKQRVASSRNCWMLLLGDDRPPWVQGGSLETEARAQIITLAWAINSVRVEEWTGSV